MKPKMRPICLFEILVDELGKISVRDFKSSWKYLMDFSDFNKTNNWPKYVSHDPL
jgi:hypothetical protein